ncbi:MAG: aspartate/glutamate racemase family protein [Bacilli bacterium]|nr:aspartate/glutamate racemase family protein [Bacilli bacterium]MBN2876262.1 aspartate/glutamate racemase family protein [Bacilli bacterium]
MKTIGLIGGMSWESTLDYYRIINEETKSALGGSHSSKCLIYSFDYHELEALMNQGSWDKLAQLVSEQAKKLEKAGAELLLICANTVHLVVPQVESKVDIPILHIAEVTSSSIQKMGLKTVGLLGTKFTMESSLYHDILSESGITCLTPDSKERDEIHHVIYHELILGKLLDSSRERFVEIINHLKNRGAQGIILGCTEIPLLIHQSDTDLPIFNTTEIHAKAAVRTALAKE